MPGWLRRGGSLALSFAVAAAGNAGLAPKTAEASSYSEPVPQPVLTHPRKQADHGPGVVIANVPYGYYIGRAFLSAKVRETFVAKAKDYAFGAITQKDASRKIVQCGWIETQSLSKYIKTVPGDPPCDPQRKILANQYSFGHDFNCGPAVCDGGTASTPLTPECNDKLYANDASLDAAIAGGTEVPTSTTASGLYDYLGKLSQTQPVHYRYTTLDNQAAVIMSDQYGWGLVDKDCIVGYPQGGPPNTENPLAPLNQEVAGVVG